MGSNCSYTHKESGPRPKWAKIIKPPIGSQRSQTHILGGKKFEETKNWAKPIWRQPKFFQNFQIPGGNSILTHTTPFLNSTTTWGNTRFATKWRLLQALRPNGALHLIRRARLERMSRPRKRNFGSDRRMGVICPRNARRVRVFVSSTVESTILSMGRLATRYLMKPSCENY